MNNDIKILAQYNGTPISVREDGYIDLTGMCKANGKRLNDFLRNKETKAYIQSMTSETGIPASQIIEVVKGKFSDGRLQGSWGHPEIAVLLAQWISKPFHRWCNTHIFVLMSDGKTSLDIDPFERMQSILSELRGDVNDQLQIDDRFHDVQTYSSWCLDEGEE